MATDPNQKFVVLHTSIAGTWWKGEVYTRAVLETKGSTVERFLSLGSVREATEEEAKLEKVDLTVDAARKGSLQQIVFDKDMEIGKLRSRAIELENENVTLKQQLADVLAKPPAADDKKEPAKKK